MNKSFRYLLFLILFLSILSGCGPARRVSDGEYLLWKNKIKSTDAKVDEESIENIIKQKPNRKILFYRFYLRIWNLKKREKVEEKIQKKQRRLEAINEDRLMDGKKPKTYSRTFWQWVQEVVGEPPVLLDSSLAETSAEQIRLYMMKKGWFDAKVDYSVSFHPEIRRPENRKRVKVNYEITAGEPYIIETIEDSISDTGISPIVLNFREKESRLKPGVQFDVDKLDEDRGKLTENLRNRGYFLLSKEYFYFNVDTSLGNHKVAVELHLTPWNVVAQNLNDTAYQVDYPVHSINDIYLSVREPRDHQTQSPDTLVQEDYKIITSDYLSIAPRVLTQNVLFKKGEIYNASLVNLTYRRLTQLSIINSTGIVFEQLQDSLNSNLLNAHITLSPAKRQNTSLEWNGTNNIGNFGINGTLGYTNRNLFRGSELFRINLSGGLEAQQLLTSTEQQSVDRSLTFNTIEFGPELLFEFPKFLLPVSMDRFSKWATPKTQLGTSFSYQQRPDYIRRRLKFSMAYTWNESDYKRWIVTPFELSLITIDKSPVFQQRLNELNDPYLTNSYNDHVIPSARISYIFNNQFLNTRRRVLYHLSEIETSGLLFRTIYNLAEAPKDENNGYTLFNVRFAHYVKLIQELRIHDRINEKTSLAYRIFGGLGIPLTNLNVLPFEKSFFSGGANGLRAWQARTLGPGSFRSLQARYDRIGDIQLEGNIEYRFDLVDVLEGAIFIDAGNIWLLRQQVSGDGLESRPGATFEWEDFASEIAIGTGFGIRLNFDYFLIRLDVGLPVKDPSLDPGERWIFQGKDKYNQFIDEQNSRIQDGNPFSHYRIKPNFNLGIGYPF